MKKLSKADEAFNMVGVLRQALAITDPNYPKDVEATKKDLDWWFAEYGRLLKLEA